MEWFLFGLWFCGAFGCKCKCESEPKPAKPPNPYRHMSSAELIADMKKKMRESKQRQATMRKELEGLTKTIEKRLKQCQDMTTNARNVSGSAETSNTE